MIKRRILFHSWITLAFLAVAVLAAPGPRQIVLGTLFQEGFAAGGDAYTYPPQSTIDIDKTTGYKSKASLKIKLVGSDFSGASLTLPVKDAINLKSQRWGSELTFMIKGAEGGELVHIGLLDEEASDGKKTQTKIPINKYVKNGKITTDWQKVVIPVADFSDRGMYYDMGRKGEFPALVDWSKITEMRVSCDKGVNKSNPVVWIDDIKFVKARKKSNARKEIFWDFVEEKIDGPKNPGKYKKGEKVLAKVFGDDFAPSGAANVYGGKTAARPQKSGTSGNSNVLAMYFDDQNWSGVTIKISQERSVDLSKVRNKGALYFWAKGAVGGEDGWVGIMDNQGKSVEVQTKVGWKDWGNVEKDQWTLFKVPLKRFLDKGLYWDADKQAEIAKDFNWKKVQSVRFSVGKEYNSKRLVSKGDAKGAVALYVDEIVFVDKCDWEDPDVYWDSFASKAKDFLLHDFEKESSGLWEGSTGPKSELDHTLGKGNLDGKSLLVKHYKLGDWVDVVADYKKQGKKFPHLNRNWTKHWAISFEIYTDKPWQGITVQIGDSGDELYVANTGAPKGRHKVLIPFRDFNKFPYYQPPHAVQNNKFDLDDVCRLDFKPSGEGTRGDFQIDNVYLTNLREIKKKKASAQSPYMITGDFKSVITDHINPGIHGINAALWDGDLLQKKTEKMVKAVPHNVIRYPGGLRADDDHWEEVLAAKDWMVDTDEFLEWCKKTNSTPMITVNFGKGTPEEAARWVRYVNKKKKANVKYWEIGNELYGNWHVSYDKYGADGGHTYGKRARQFIEAMKKEDPSIQVTFVGVLEGEWNKNVLKYVKDVADGIIVHHYPQHFGEENDYALLAAPQTLDGIIPSVRKQLKEWGDPNKDYVIWLTEWNSVDFNPGPQTIGLSNALFVADYLGMLAKHNVDIANYWALHNSLTPEGGDYGYLTRTGDPTGDNVPRPSYWAFKLAATALQGKLYKTETIDDNVTSYLTQNGKTKTLLIINKSKETSFKTKLNISGFKGKATIEVLEEKNKTKGPSKTTQSLKKGSVVNIPKFSVVKVTIH